MEQSHRWMSTSGGSRSEEAQEAERELARLAVSRDELLAHLRQLYGDLLAVIERDPEQEIVGVALPVVDWVLSTARSHLAVSHPPGVSAGIVDLISPRTCGEGVPVRALDAWLVIGQLLAAVAPRGEH